MTSSEICPPGDEILSEIRQRQRALADNFIHSVDDYLGGVEVEGVKLQEHQLPSMEKFRDVLIETRDTADCRVLTGAPPGYGKSFLGTFTVKRMGIGEVPRDSRRPLRALGFVPRDLARRQLMGACRQNAPNLRVAEYMPKEDSRKFDDHDMLLLTYKAVADIPEHKWRDLIRNTDLMMLDEAHLGIGEQVGARLLHAMDTYHPTVYAMSASPKYDNDRTVMKAFRITHTLPSPTTREAAELHITNGVRLFAVNTGQQLALGSKRHCITEEDVAPLIDNEARNNLLTEIMQMQGFYGKPGLAWCLPGGDEIHKSNRHAIMIAEQASDLPIIDPKTGEDRLLRVEAIGRHLARRARDELEERFRCNDIDFVTMTKYWREAFDCDLIRTLLCATPTASAVDMEQFLGRGARRGPDTRLTDVYYLMDAYTSYAADKRIWTPFDVYDAHNDPFQGMIIASPQQTRQVRSAPQRLRQPRTQQSSGPGETHKRHSTKESQDPYWQELQQFPGLLDAMTSMPIGAILARQVVSRSGALPQEAPPGYRLAMDLAPVKQGLVTTEALRYKFSGEFTEEGKEMIVAVRLPHEGFSRLYVAPEAMSLIENRYGVQEIVRRSDMVRFFLERGWPEPAWDTFILNCKQSGIHFDDSRKDLFMSPDDARKYLKHIIKTPLVDPAVEIAVSDLAKAFRVHTSELSKKIRSRENLSGSMRERRRGKPPQAHRVVGAIAVDGAIRVGKLFAKTSKNMQAHNIGIGDIEGLVEEVCGEYLNYYRVHGLKPVITPEDVDAFIDELVSHQPKPAAPEVARASESYQDMAAAGQVQSTEIGASPASSEPALSSKPAPSREEHTPEPAPETQSEPAPATPPSPEQQPELQSPSETAAVPLPVEQTLPSEEWVPVSRLKTSAHATERALRHLASDPQFADSTQISDDYLALSTEAVPSFLKYCKQIESAPEGWIPYGKACTFLFEQGFSAQLLSKTSAHVFRMNNADQRLEVHYKESVLRALTSN